jgi:hypothetical protein
VVKDSNKPVQVLPSKGESVANIKVNSANTQMKLKNSYKVWVELDPKKQVNLDAIDLYVKYDKTAFTVSKLDFSGMSVKPSFSKISDTKSVVVVNYFVTESKGLAVKNGEVSKLVGFEVTPKKIGDYSFEISMGDEAGTSKTMLVENMTSKELSFDVTKLNVSVR